MDFVCVRETNGEECEANKEGVDGAKPSVELSRLDVEEETKGRPNCGWC